VRRTCRACAVAAALGSGCGRTGPTPEHGGGGGGNRYFADREATPAATERTRGCA
jgi:hypothetical protein